MYKLNVRSLIKYITYFYKKLQKACHLVKINICFNNTNIKGGFMRKAKMLFLYVFTVLIVPTFVFANGFQINEQGAKALGMGGAFVAQADDPSALYFNPAGITYSA
ncbi:MAG: hypothetical protein FXF54_14905 [Kosmotoga sp.]|nr:MAG: hypothetical protein FXF54_14905 [Kosmotoga sp.]